MPRQGMSLCSSSPLGMLELLGTNAAEEATKTGRLLANGSWTCTLDMT